MKTTISEKRGNKREERQGSHGECMTNPPVPQTEDTCKEGISKDTSMGVSREGVKEMVPSSRSAGCACSSSSAALSHAAPKECPQAGRWLCDLLLILVEKLLFPTQVGMQCRVLFW